VKLSRLGLIVTLLLGLLAAPLAAEAQPAGKVYRIGHIAPPDFDRPERVEQRSWPAFIQGLNSLGWIEGKNIVFERRLVGDYGPSQQQAAEDFVRMKVDVIVLVGGGRATMVQKVTGTIPIVTLNAGELVASGIVASLARPGGNITGMQGYNPELMGKRLQMLKEIIPTLSRVAALRRGSWHQGILAAYRQATDDPAQKLGIRVRYVTFQSSDALPGVFAEIVKERDTALLIWNDPSIDPLLARQIVDLAGKHRLPTMAEDSDWPKRGALVAYGPKTNDIYRQAAMYVDHILKGAKPADLPIGQPTTFELVFNMKTAKALGLTIPPLLLLRADKVIE
jgi:putative tryptophan/tyrosine transport system substrate-binding protein